MTLKINFQIRIILIIGAKFNMRLSYSMFHHEITARETLQYSLLLAKQNTQHFVGVTANKIYCFCFFHIGKHSNFECLICWLLLEIGTPNVISMREFGAESNYIRF